MKTQYIVSNSIGTYYYSDKAMTELHREDGPAVELADGSTFWYFNNKYHRTNGPAVEYPNEYPDYYPHGYRAWYIHGVRCRADGPAIENADGELWWFINGKRVTEQEHRDFYNPPKPKTVSINGEEFTVEELKALIYSDKALTKLYREDGPAVELADGSKFWTLNGKCHREDGPAIENADGTKLWFLSGKNITQEEHALLTKKDTTININGKDFTLEELNSLIETAEGNIV